MRAYNLLLRLYPASFRNEYGEEMRALFARNRREANGWFGMAGIWLLALADTARNATLAHADILRQDLRFTARLLRRSPGFAVTAVLLVGLGIGATTAAFSVTDFVLLRPLPFFEPQRLVTIMEATPGYATMELSGPNYRDWTAVAKSFESTAVYHAAAVTMTGATEPRRFLGTSVSANFFSTLGVVPLIGRSFRAEDDQADAAGTVILSYQLWQTEFGGDRTIVGRSLTFDDRPYTVIGVMPREFHYPAGDIQLWIPNRFTEANFQESERSDNWLYSVGRLRPGLTPKQAAAEMSAIAAQSEKDHPIANKSTGAAVRALGTAVPEQSRLLLFALTGAAGCVLLIACANLTNLLLARALVRGKELAVRTAMGAGRERLVRQLMTESVLIAAVGGALGVALAIVCVPLLVQLVPATLPIAATPTVDARVLMVALALTVITVLAFGLAPVLRSTAPQSGLREGSRAGIRHKERLRSTLVIVEITASVVLVVSAGLLLRALLNVRSIDPGFKPAGVITMRTELAMPEYLPAARRQAFYDQVLGEVRALAGVTAAGFVSFLPMSSMRGGIWPVSVKGDTGATSMIRGADNVAAIRYVTPGYFAAMAIPLLRGRDISEADAENRPAVAVVSQSFGKRYWPHDEPIGRHFDIGDLRDREVVGVVGDVRFRGLEGRSEPQVYLSPQQTNRSISFYAPRSLAVRTSVEPTRLAPMVRDIVHRADPRAPITSVRTLDEMVNGETTSRSVQVQVVTAFAVLAFVLAALGIHGLLSFVVSQRTPEIGVRMALGAQRRTILSMVMSRGVMLTAAGVVPGVLLAYASGRSLQALLVGLEPADALTFSGAIVLSMLMTVVGTLAPTLRALRVNPAAAFRAE